MTELSEKAEEILESLWISSHEDKVKNISLGNLKIADDESIEQLVTAGYISVTGEYVTLTRQGNPVASGVVRRHRLAERLLIDVLGTGDSLSEEKACKFEHLLDHGLDESICCLLGHPKICPHGKPIPSGECCRQEQKETKRLISALSQLNNGQEGKVAYLHAPEADKLQKLMAMGILPGAPINLIQTFPSYVFQVHETQFAVDKEIADAIYVRLTEEKTDPQTTNEPSPEKNERSRRQPRFFSLKRS